MSIVYLYNMFDNTPNIGPDTLKGYDNKKFT